MALSVPRFAMAEHKRMTYCVNPEEGTSFEEVLTPGYWAHVSGKLRVLDQIEVVPDDMSYHATLLVLDAGRSYAKVAVLHKVDIGPVDTAAVPDAEYEIKLRGPHKWSIVRVSDKAVIKEGIATREDANLELAGHLKALAA
jgi:hypothetical protein